MKKKMSRFVSSPKACDRSILISLCTAAVFLLLGVTQLFTLMLAPAARTSDRIVLLLVDFLIAAACVLYILAQSGRLSGLSDKLRGAGKIAHAPKKSPAKKENTPRSVPASQRRNGNAANSPGSTFSQENAAVSTGQGSNASSRAPSRQPVRFNSRDTNQQ